MLLTKPPDTLFASVTVVLVALAGCDKAQPPTPQPVVASPADVRQSKPPVTFNVPNTTITVRIPNEPSSDHYIASTELGDIQIYMYNTEDQQLIHYAAGVSEYPVGFVEKIAPDQGEFLERMADAALQKRPGSRIISRQDIALGDWPGLDERIEMPGGRTGQLDAENPMITRRRYFHDGDRMYMFQIMTLKSVYESAPEDFDQKATEFLGSIRTQTRKKRNIIG